MTCRRLLPVLTLVAVSLLAASASAGPRSGGVGLPLDPELLPANSGPGDCVTRRVTGPGGAYRWDRVECDAGRGGGYGGYDRPLDIETRGDAYSGDRYGESRYRDARYQSAYGDGYEQGRGDPDVSYPPPYASGYVAAGRDEAGYLIWPGKLP